MNEYEAKKLLSEYSIKVPRGVLIEKASQIEGIDLNYPLVVKVVSKNILHKTDVGGVILNLKNREELKKIAKEMMEKFKSPVLVEEMLSGGIEAIVGVMKDATFGHAIMFGLGGIFTEVFRDVTFRVIPINRRDAELMLTEIKGRKILEGYRGTKVSKDAAIDLLLKVSRLVEEHPEIEGMDLNPVLLRESDAVVLDAKIILGD